MRHEFEFKDIGDSLPFHYDEIRNTYSPCRFNDDIDTWHYIEKLSQCRLKSAL